MSLFPGQLNLQHYRGDTFEQRFAFTTIPDPVGAPTVSEPVDMTGGTLLAQVRDGTSLDAAIFVTFEVVDFIPDEGTFSLHLDPAATEAASWTVGHYDVEFTDGNGVVQTLFFGQFQLTPDESRDE
jgi:hypothetical protein